MLGSRGQAGAGATGPPQGAADRGQRHSRAGTKAVVAQASLKSVAGVSGGLQCPAGNVLLPAFIHQLSLKGGEQSSSRVQRGADSKSLTATEVLPHEWEPPSSLKVKVVLQNPTATLGLGFGTAEQSEEA